MGSTPAFLWGCEGSCRAPCCRGETQRVADPSRRRSIGGGARAAIGPRRAGRFFIVALAKERSGEASHTTESVRGRVSRVRSRISRAHDLTAWNASALGQRARPTG